MEINWLQGVDLSLLMSAVLLPQKEKALQDACSEWKQQLINCKIGFQGPLMFLCFDSILTGTFKFVALLVFHILAQVSKIKQYKKIK